jgi:hypothetical protein
MKEELFVKEFCGDGLAYRQDDCGTEGLIVNFYQQAQHLLYFTKKGGFILFIFRALHLKTDNRIVNSLIRISSLRKRSDFRVEIDLRKFHSEEHRDFLAKSLPFPP